MDGRFFVPDGCLDWKGKSARGDLYPAAAVNAASIGGFHRDYMGVRIIYPCRICRGNHRKSEYLKDAGVTRNVFLTGRRIVNGFESPYRKGKDRKSTRLNSSHV